MSLLCRTKVPRSNVFLDQTTRTGPTPRGARGDPGAVRRQGTMYPRLARLGQGGIIETHPVAERCAPLGQPR